MWILWKLRIWNSEFCAKWDFENVSLVKNDLIFLTLENYHRIFPSPVMKVLKLLDWHLLTRSWRFGWIDLELRAFDVVVFYSITHDNLDASEVEVQAYWKGKNHFRVDFLDMNIVTYLSGSTFCNQSQLSASVAVNRFLGSKANMLSKRSRARSGISGPNSSRTRRRYCFLGLTLANPGRFMTSGQLAGHGVPQSLDITDNWAISSLAYEIELKLYFLKNLKKILSTYLKHWTLVKEFT